MFVHYRTIGLIFKKDDRGETDQLFTIYTKDFGKLEILGKAIRKISSKLRSGAELFYLSEIEFIQGKTQKTLTDTILINKFENLREDLKRLRIAYRISEVLDSLIKGPEANEKIWQLLNEAFQRLDTTNLKPITCNLIYHYFLWNLLSILGYELQLYNCAVCQKKLLPEKLYFNPKEGGIICHDCFKKVKLVKEDRSSSSPATLSRGARKSGSSFDFAAARVADELRSSSRFANARVGKEINIETIKILRIILEKNWATLSKLKIEEKYLKELFLLSKSYFSLIVDEANASVA